ncbi:MAG: DNA-processing protein DprA [Halofilum sp. (in: g-proteobacteria)]|nr:DNA-processing protein DprA [Halofilum sp. (in: g-proteobacteria)]
MNRPMEGVEPWLRLVHAPGVGPASTRDLLARFGEPAAIVAGGRKRLREAGLDAAAIELLLTDEPPEGVRRDLEWAQCDRHHLLTLADPRYPARLREIHDPPPVLYVLGDPEVLAYPAIAMVGSRHPTPAGRDTARAFARHLAGSGLIVNSGLALGIDAASHQGALDADGLTVAVAGTGLDRVYPSRHADLARRIGEQGALVSELPVGTRPTREAFPRRNRILSGLSTGTLVVEAALRSGSLITARCALEQGRELFAVPGSIHNPLARGCHALIRQGAKLVETAGDVLEELAPVFGPLPGEDETDEAPPGKSATATGDPEYARLLACIDWEPRGVDELSRCSSLSAASVASMLLRLELEGVIRSVPGGLYQRR